MALSVSTAAMVVVLSAFNGIEKMVEDLYSDFDPTLTISSSQSKTFNQHFLPIAQIQQLTEVQQISRIIEEVVLVRHEKRWVNATVFGVDSTFLNMAKADTHLVQGHLPEEFQNNVGLVGIELLSRLDGTVFESVSEHVLIYAANRNAQIGTIKKPFNIRKINLVGAVSYNQEVNSTAVIVPLSVAKSMLNYGDDITRLGIKLKNGSEVLTVKEKIQKLVGKHFVVKTNIEKNALIFKTSKVEKIIVFCILIFIFILATFNMVASLTMLFIEKKDNLKTMLAFGMPQKSVFSIFFTQGSIICVVGILLGLVLGYAIVALQLFGELLVIPNSGGQVFPIGVKYTDALMIIIVTLSVGFISAWIPVKILAKRFNNQIQKNKNK